MKLRRKNYDLRLVFGGGILASLIVLIFDKDFGVNLLTEIGSVALTVFVINKIIERRERQRRVAIDQRILRDIQAITASYWSIWKHLVWQYMPSEKINSEQDFQRVYRDLVSKARMNETFEFVSIHHPESWNLFFNNRVIKDCFINYQSTLTKQIQSFIDDYRIYIDPELLDILLNLLESQYFKDLYLLNQDQQFMSVTILDMGEDPNKLETYLQVDDDRHLKQFAILHNYGVRLSTMINQFTDVNVEIYNVKKYFIHPTAQFNAYTN
jgi:hypothetical protein